MRNLIGGAVGLMAVGLLALAPAGASAQEMKAESKLLGNKLWNTHRDVLAKHGQPTRIELGATAGAPSAPGGAAPMSGGGGAPSMGAGMGGSRMPQGGMPSGPPSGMNYGAMMMRGMGGGGGKMGAMNSGGGGGGLPGMGGMGMQGGPGEGMGMGGGTGGGPGAGADEGDITWVYERGPLTDMFLFNKDGRLIQIASFGYSGGQAVTSKGVRLGDPIGKVLAQYGWTSNIEKDPARGTMSLDYSKDHHVSFQMAEKNKVYHVVGITIGITELAQLNVVAPGVEFGNARRTTGAMNMGGRPGGMGAPMMGGMPGGISGGGKFRPGVQGSGGGGGGGRGRAGGSGSAD